VPGGRDGGDLRPERISAEVYPSALLVGNASLSDMGWSEGAWRETPTNAKGCGILCDSEALYRLLTRGV
jgi:hypothetical protein